MPSAPSWRNDNEESGNGVASVSGGEKAVTSYGKRGIPMQIGGGGNIRPILAHAGLPRNSEKLTHHIEVTRALAIIMPEISNKRERRIYAQARESGCAAWGSRNGRRGINAPA